MSYLWEQTAGPTVSLVNAAGGLAAFTATEAGTYAFCLTVSDGTFEATDIVQVVVTTQTQAPARVVDALRVEPNAVSAADLGLVRIFAPAGAEQGPVTIWSVSGNRVAEIVLEAREGHAEGVVAEGTQLAAGLYVVVAADGKEKARFVVTR